MRLMQLVGTVVVLFMGMYGCINLKGVVDDPVFVFP